MSNLRDNIQLNLVRLINERNLSQKEFAEMLGVSQAAVTNWVKGKNSPDIEVIAKICELLNISITQLIGKPQITFQKKSPMTFSQKLHNKRIETGLSIEELAEASGISVSEIKNYEYGISKPKNENQIQMLAKALNTEYFNLLTDDTSAIKVADSGFNGNPISDSKKSHSENLLISNFNSLNKQGKDKLLEYSDDLVCSGKYLKTEQKKSTPKN